MRSILWILLIGLSPPLAAEPPIILWPDGAPGALGTQHGIPHELHLYQDGDHGTGLIGTEHPWFDDLLFWLKSRKFLP